MNIIVAVDDEWGIGRNGQLLFCIPEDMRNFRNLTLGKVVVMGRGTFESLPKQQPLSQRVNIVLSKYMEIKNGIEMCRDVVTLFKVLCKYKTEDIFVIGGASIYRLLLDYCEYAFVTRMSGIFNADRFFPNIAENQRWKLERTVNENRFENVEYRFEVYSNKYVRRIV